MITYQDFINATDKLKFITSAISTYRRSSAYLTALDADEYEAQRNVGIVSYVKKIYDITGVSVPDVISADNRLTSNFFHRLNTDRCTYSLGNGVTFADDGSGIKEQLGETFDTELYKAAYFALEHGISFLYVAGNEYFVFPMTEFLPLWDEETGIMRAGLRFWSLDWKRRAAYVTLFEEDGFTKYRSKDGKPGLAQMEEIQPKRGYVQTVQYSEACGEVVVGERNYSALPVVPVYANKIRQSSLVGLRPKIDAYDMIQSGFANDLQDCAQVYWLISGAMGTDDNDIRKLKDRLLFQHVAVVDNENASLQGYTQDIPYEARKQCLDGLRNQMYEDFAVLDVHTISAGATNDHIDAGYQPMDQEADDFEYEMIKVIQQVECLKGMAPLVPTFKRNRISNQREQTEMVLSALDVIDKQTALKKIPWITVDEIEQIMLNKDAEELTGQPTMKALQAAMGEDEEQ